MTSQDDLFDFSDEEDLKSEESAEEIPQDSGIIVQTTESILEVTYSNKMSTSGEVVIIVNSVKKHGKIVDANPTCQTLLGYLSKVASIDWNDGTKSVVALLTNAAIKLFEDYEDATLWETIQTHTDETAFCIMETVREHAGLVMRECLSIVDARTNEEEMLEDHDVNDKSFIERVVPIALIHRWAKVITQRRLDKSSRVRSSAISALSSLPHKSFEDFEKKSFFPNHYVLNSLRDVDHCVRESSIKCVSFIDHETISACISSLKQETKPELRRLFSAKLINRVHIDSFSPSQRAQLVVIIFNDSDSIVRRIGQDRLVKLWKEENKMDYGSEVMGDSHIVRVINTEENEDAARLFIKYAFKDEMSKSDNLVEFVEEVKTRHGMMSVDNWSTLMESKDASSVNRPLILLEECIHLILTEHEDDLCMIVHRLLPSLTDIIHSLHKLSQRWLQGEDHSLEEKVIARILSLAEILDHSDYSAMNALEEFLKFVILSPLILPTRDLILFSVNMIIQYFGEEKTRFESLRDWAIYEMNTLLYPPSQEDVEPPEANEAMRWRCSIVLMSLLQHDSHSPLDTLSKCLFEKMIPHIRLSSWDIQRETAAMMIGAVCMKDESMMTVHVGYLKDAIDLDNEIRETALQCLSHVVCVHGVEKVAASLYPQWDEECDMKREVVLLSLFHQYLSPSCKTCLSCTALSCCIRIMEAESPMWPTALYMILIISSHLEKDMNGVQKMSSEWLNGKCDWGVEWRLAVVHSVYSLLNRQTQEPIRCSMPAVLAKAISLCRKRNDEENDTPEWILVCILAQKVIDDPESGLNKAIVGSLQGMNVMEVRGLVKRKMESALERLVIYEQTVVAKMMTRIVDRMGDGKTEGNKRRKRRREASIQHD